MVADRKSRIRQALASNASPPNLEPPPKALHPEPLNLFEGPVDRRLLAPLEGRSILSIADLSRDEVIELCRLAAALEAVEIGEYHVLDGKIVITAFFEPSTRTRTSFESAVLRLDGKIISIPEGRVTGTAKGESLSDIGEMFNAYGDLVVLRHTETSALEDIRRNLRLPLINAGNGSGEHPTQALADWYALLKWRPELASDDIAPSERLNLGILGTPGSMRAVKSFLYMSLLFSRAIRKVTVISEMADPFGSGMEDEIRAAGLDFEVSNDIQVHLGELEVIYMNSIALLGDSYKTLDARYKLDSSSPLKEDAVILHPLARLDELDTSLDHTRHNLYFSQAHGAVFVRQALLTTTLGRFDRLPREIALTGEER
ncbi:MAG: aspartate carbamoyltransferase [Gemmatimonadota bacterium]